MANFEDTDDLDVSGSMVSILKNLSPKSKSFAALVIAAVSLLCFFPVLLWGVPAYSADLVHHIQISNAYVDGLRHGRILLDWVDAENGGYGSVTVRFYPPLIHITIALFKLILVRMGWAIFAAFSLWSMIGCLGMYLWTRDIVGGAIAPLAAAVLFAISPYHLNQFYNASMLGEFVSLSTLPFAFYFTRRLCAIGGAKNVIGLTCSMSALVLSNIPQTVVCFPFIAVYALLCLEREHALKRTMMLGASGILAAACTSFYWVRVVAEMSWIHISEPNNDPNYNFRNNFLFTSIDAGSEGIEFGSLMLVILLALITCFLLASGKWRSVLRDHQTRGPLLILLLSIFMALPFSTYLWEASDILQRVQFPWRFLSVVTVAASLIMAYCLGTISRETIRENRPVVLIMIGCVFILATFSVKQVIMGAVFTENDLFNNKAEASRTADGLYHWLPVWADKDTFREQAYVLAGNRQVNISRWGHDAHAFSISGGDSTTVRTAILYYPWWRVTVNSKEVEALDLDGALAFDIGTETSDCSLSFREPRSTGISRAVSLVSITGMLLFLAAAVFRREFFYE